MLDVIINNTGFYLPKEVISNNYLIKTLGLDTTQKWIINNTGIHERRRASPDVKVSDIAYWASKQCLDRADVNPKDIGIIIVSTVTPDMLFPATANILQEKLGNKKAYSHENLEERCKFSMTHFYKISIKIRELVRI